MFVYFAYLEHSKIKQVAGFFWPTLQFTSVSFISSLLNLNWYLSLLCPDWNKKKKTTTCLFWWNSHYSYVNSTNVYLSGGMNILSHFNLWPFLMKPLVSNDRYKHSSDKEEVNNGFVWSVYALFSWIYHPLYYEIYKEEDGAVIYLFGVTLIVLIVRVLQYFQLPCWYNSPFFSQLMCFSTRLILAHAECCIFIVWHPAAGRWRPFMSLYFLFTLTMITILRGLSHVFHTGNIVLTVSL